MINWEVWDILTVLFMLYREKAVVLSGAVPEIEYMAVYTSHLRPARRLIWKLLHALSQGYYKKILIKYKL